MHIITDTPQYHWLQGDTNMQLESSTCWSTFMNQGHYLIKLLAVFMKILTDCESFIDIGLSDFLSRNVKDYHPAFSLCLNWFKRHISRVLKVSNCKELQCALVSVYISVGLRHTMTGRFSNCHFWTCFAMSKHKETMCRIRLWTNKVQTTDRTKFGNCSPNEQAVSQKGDFNWHHGILPNFHSTVDPMQGPAGSVVSYHPPNLRDKMLSTTSWEKGLDTFWFGKVSFSW